MHGSLVGLAAGALAGDAIASDQERCCPPPPPAPCEPPCPQPGVVYYAPSQPVVVYGAPHGYYGGPYGGPYGGYGYGPYGPRYVRRGYYYR